MKKEKDSNIYRLIHQAVMERIIGSGSFIIPQISEDTGISMTTVGKYMAMLFDEGIVEPIDTIKNDKRGRRPVLYGAKAAKKYFAAFEVKQFETVYGLMDISGNLIARKTADIPYENTSSRLEMICKGLEDFLVSNGGLKPDDLLGICVTLGGRVNSKEGHSASKFVLEELTGVSLSEFLTERFGVETMVENDTKAMALGEYISLKDKTLKNALYVNVTWGIGLGIIIDGKLYYGKDGYSGEFGHAPLYDNDIFCHCGKKGCLETEVSGSAIHRKLLERLKAGETSRLSPKYYRGETISLADIIDAANHEDPLCIDLISKTASELGRQMSTLINIFNPEAIILGGDLCQAASFYFTYPLRASIRKYSLKLMIQDIQFFVSELGEKAGVYGACMAIRNRYFTNLGLQD